MSRIGSQPLKVPAGVQISVAGGELLVKGPKGEVTFPMPHGIAVEVEGDVASVKRTGNGKAARAAHGLVRRVLGNNVLGVVEPFSRALEIVGVGYQANVRGGKSVGLKVGFANEVVLPIPEGVVVETPSVTKIVIRGCDKQKVGQLAANIRRVRPPEPYTSAG
jgi:large subunit ribosomal protein L6